MMETDADRRNMLLALGGSSDITVRGEPITALYSPEPLRVSFDDAQMSGQSHTLQCLWTDAKRFQFAIDDPVAVPGEGDFYVVDIGNEDGMALLTLRKA
jgi:hypothetical protein